jgi:hypothetical protein
MLNKAQFRIVLALSVLALILAVLNAVFSSRNRALQTDIATRNQFVQQSLQLQPLHQGLIRNLVEAAAANKDSQISDLLVSQGITFKFNPAPEKSENRPLKR